MNPDGGRECAIPWLGGLFPLEDEVATGPMYLRPRLSSPTKSPIARLLPGDLSSLIGHRAPRSADPVPPSTAAAPRARARHHSPAPPTSSSCGSSDRGPATSAAAG